MIAEHAAELGAKKAIETILGAMNQSPAQAQNQAAVPPLLPNGAGFNIPNLDSIITKILDSLLPKLLGNNEENPLGFDLADYKRFRDIRDSLFREKMKVVAKAVEDEFHIRIPQEAHQVLDTP